MNRLQILLVVLPLSEHRRKGAYYRYHSQALFCLCFIYYQYNTATDSKSVYHAYWCHNLLPSILQGSCIPTQGLQADKRL
jgi:hypothetical protein